MFFCLLGDLTPAAIHWVDVLPQYVFGYWKKSIQFSLLRKSKHVFLQLTHSHCNTHVLCRRQSHCSSSFSFRLWFLALVANTCKVLFSLTEAFIRFHSSRSQHLKCKVLHHCNLECLFIPIYTVHPSTIITYLALMVRVWCPNFNTLNINIGLRFNGSWASRVSSACISKEITKFEVGQKCIYGRYGCIVPSSKSYEKSLQGTLRDHTKKKYWISCARSRICA